MVRKQYLEIEIYKKVRIHCKAVSINAILAKIWNFVVNIQIVSYYDDVINCDVTFW